MREALCRKFLVLMLLPLAALAVLAVPQPAAACGGFFCSITPIDQNAERILFVVNGDGTLSVHVEISYTGAADAFSWVLPVPETPTLDVVPASTLQLLDAATGVRIIPPPTDCGNGKGLFAPTAEDAGGPGGVTVEDLPQVGPFDPTVVSSGDAQLLIDWLNTNGYLITAEMEPFIQSYVDNGMKFLAMKLAPGSDVADITPIKMTYASYNPMVPLVLTAIAAEPEMSVIVFVLADQRYESMNYANRVIDAGNVMADPLTGMNNYFALVSWLIDNAGGQAMIAQYADSSLATASLVNQAFVTAADGEQARQYLQGLLSQHAYLTRMYSRISSDEMQADPEFWASTGGNVSNIFDLSNRPPIQGCLGDDVPPVPCGATYCGVDSVCATTASTDGCVCAQGSVARSITTPRGPGAFTPRSVTCQTTSFDLFQSVPQGIADACAGVDCGGHGACLNLNGAATCRCDNDYAAVVDGQNSLRTTCVRALHAYAPSQLLWPGWPFDNGCNCAAAGGLDVSMALGGLALLWWRRRTRA